MVSGVASEMAGGGVLLNSTPGCGLQPVVDPHRRDGGLAAKKPPRFVHIGNSSCAGARRHQSDPRLATKLKFLRKGCSSKKGNELFRRKVALVVVLPLCNIVPMPGLAIRVSGVGNSVSLPSPLVGSLVEGEGQPEYMVEAKEVVRLGKRLGISFGDQEDVLLQQIIELETRDGEGPRRDKDVGSGDQMGGLVTTVR